MIPSTSLSTPIPGLFALAPAPVGGDAAPSFGLLLAGTGLNAIANGGIAADPAPPPVAALPDAAMRQGGAAPGTDLPPLPLMPPSPLPAPIVDNEASVATAPRGKMPLPNMRTIDVETPIVPAISVPPIAVDTVLRTPEGQADMAPRGHRDASDDDEDDDIDIAPSPLLAIPLPMTSMPTTTLPAPGVFAASPAVMSAPRSLGPILTATLPSAPVTKPVANVDDAVPANSAPIAIATPSVRPPQPATLPDQPMPPSPMIGVEPAMPVIRIAAVAPKVDAALPAEAAMPLGTAASDRDIDLARLMARPAPHALAATARPVPAQAPVELVLSAAPPTQGPAVQVFGAAIAAVRRGERSIDARDIVAAPAHPMDALGQIAIAATGDTQAPLDMTQQRWPHAMVDRIEHLRDAAAAIAASTADTRIRLVPDSLGTIDVAIAHDGDTVSVRFQADHAATRALLQESQGRLAEIAEARGLRLSGSSVDTSSAGTGQHQPPARQPQPVIPAAPPRASTPDTVTAEDVPSVRVA